MSKSSQFHRFGVCSLVAALLVAATACGTSPYFPPRDVAHIKFEYRSSPAVIVEKAWFERRNGQLSLVGYVSASAEDVDTTRTRLDVTFHDARGAALQSFVATFEPAQVPRPVRLRGGISSFKIPLPALATETVHVTVAARDG